MLSSNAVTIATQLMACANEDDRLGRGEFQLMSVEVDPHNSKNFVITIQTRDDPPIVEHFHVKVEKL